jgi:putative nucleotidyltransferase with HDIG domain
MPIRDSIIEKLNGLTNLPSMNETARRVQEQLSRTEATASSASAIGKIIEKDLGLIANSVFYTGKYGQIGDMGHAVARLGVMEVSQICAMVSSIQLFSDTKGTIVLQEFWKHSVGVAIVMRHIGERAVRVARQLPNAYTAGLFHDIGIIVLDRYFSNLYKGVLDAEKKEPLPLFETERMMLGIDHGEIGAFLCKKWRLPEEICCAVEFHHAPDLCPEDHRRLAQLVNIADFACSVLGIPEPGDAKVSMGSAGAWHDLGLDDCDLNTIAEEVEEGIARSGVFVSLSL